MLSRAVKVLVIQQSQDRTERWLMMVRERQRERERERERGRERECVREREAFLVFDIFFPHTGKDGVVMSGEN